MLHCFGILYITIIPHSRHWIGIALLATTKMLLGIFKGVSPYMSWHCGRSACKYHTGRLSVVSAVQHARPLICSSSSLSSETVDSAETDALRVDPETWVVAGHGVVRCQQGHWVVALRFRFG
jgi:hypothetical protein